MIVLMLLLLAAISILALVYKFHGAKVALFALVAFIAGMLLSHFLATV